MRPFIVLPGQALIDLREELEIIEGEEAGGTIERFGYRAGVNLVKELGIECTFEELEDMVPQLWYEAGLSGIDLKVSEDEIVAYFNDSVEAIHGRGCDFARGYLMGMVSHLLQRRYAVVESECSDDRSICRNVLKPAEEMDHKPAKKQKGRPKLDLERGYSYLIETDNPNSAFNLFQDYLRHGTSGMCISREYPEKIKKAYDLESATMFWLSYDRDIPYAREPTNIPLIYSEVKNFLDDDQEAVVLISGLEYMISQSNFIKILKFVQLLNENVAVRDSLLILPLSPEALEDKEVKMLERELRVLQLD